MRIVCIFISKLALAVGMDKFPIITWGMLIINMELQKGHLQSAIWISTPGSLPSIAKYFEIILNIVVSGYHEIYLL